MCKQAEGEGTGGKEKDPNPYRQVQNPVETRVPRPDFALLGIFNLSTITHGREFLRLTASESIVGPLPKAKASYQPYN